MDKTFFLEYRDNSSPRFDGKVFTIPCSSVVSLNGVSVKGVAPSDLKEGDAWCNDMCTSMASSSIGRGLWSSPVMPPIE